MSTELVWVAPEDRATALRGYRRLLVGRRLDAATDSFRVLREAFGRVWESVKRAVSDIFDVLRPFFRRTFSRSARYADCQAYYGVRRVTARQYRAWKRQVGRA